MSLLDVEEKMTITVIEQTTEERKNETEELFLECKPYLDKGYPLAKAVQKVKNSNHSFFYRQAWFKELREYARSKGYEPQR